MTDWNAYDGFLQEADADDRVGEHDAVVESVEEGHWPSGDPFTKIIIMLTTANMAKADLTLNPLLDPDELEARKATWDRNRKWAEGKNIRLHRELSQHYGINDPAKIERGMTLRVKTTKTKVNEATGKGGFIRVSSVLPKSGDVSAPEMPKF